MLRDDKLEVNPLKELRNITNMLVEYYFVIQPIEVC